ncbi:MAG: DUF1566 domain-containing protein, partial [Lentisphaeria bacterium]|nr:DUF1566 domain-containing protein [Lentisphaeria bacterium]
EEDCGDRECGPSPNLGNDCGTCTEATENCIFGKCVILEWQDSPEDIPMDWQQAIDYCVSLSLDGHSDWHLPSISELRSLIRGCSAIETGGSCGVTDDCLSYYACRDSFCEGCFVGQGPAGCYWPTGMEGSCFTYWSSSPCEDGDDGDGAWSVDFNSGHVYSFVKTGGYYVRCVRRGE